MANVRTGVLRRSPADGATTKRSGAGGDTLQGSATLHSGKPPDAAAFLARVHELGGKIVIVTNCAAGECLDTEANLCADGLPFAVMLCQPAGARG